MTIEDKLCAEIMVKYNKMQDMISRVVNELNDPAYDKWGDGGWEDADLLESLCKDVEKLLEEL